MPWPTWPKPKDSEIIKFARVLVRFVRFLHPPIIHAVVEDNRSHSDEWSASLDDLGIDPDIYLWDGSACVFPGVRRYTGSREIAEFRKQSTSKFPPAHCLAIDDNDYPKHLWSYVFNGTPFRKRGPDDYQLAHLIDHKRYGNRWKEELDAPSALHPPAPFGQFTNATNSVFVPSAYFRPTDLSAQVRRLLQRRAQQLYGDSSCLVRPPWTVKRAEGSAWEVERFDWADPVGSMDHVSAFLDFRRERMDELIKNREAARSAHK